ncbi:cadherin-16 isoform X2 [Suncus etruscus]|uniref:cadherin-16 isoform X2 n=1 Tax=Suncus etruscus TaxID=109475 RepID=UPI00211052AE|nr:cadherin-16 isoform X2 [Suncus etruscus]
MVSAWLWLLCLCLPHAFPQSLSAELYVEVPENYGGNFPLYLTKIPLPQERAEDHIVLSGSAGTAVQGPFAVDPESGFLLVTAALDREEQAEYQLQVTLESQQGHLLWGPQPVRVRVKDENDQVPHFSQEVYRVRLSQGTRAGIAFLFLEASDGDEPGTPNSDLRFHILTQVPSQPFPNMFQLDSQQGALALSPKGSTHFAQALGGPYQLLVQVKDMGDQASGYQATATVVVSVIASTWVPLEPLRVPENLQVLYPHLIAQVHWSGDNVYYSLDSQPPGPFDVDAEGKLYVTQELDREAQAEYLLQVRAQNSHHEDYVNPLALPVVVMDENDNAPICPPLGSPITITELSPPGTQVTRLLAEDADAPGSPNSHVVYHLLSSEAEEGVEEPVFELDSTSGTVILGSVPLQAGQNFLLRVVAADLGGAEGGLSSTCEVAVTVLDINDHAPEFTTAQIQTVSLREDAEPGTLVAMLTATDADLEPAFRLMTFAITAGDAEGLFGLVWEPESTHVQLQLLKKLSYEAAPRHEVVVVVRNVAELVGPDPGPQATATVTVLVERVVPAPKLNPLGYKASIPVSTPAGSLLLTIEPSEPTSNSVRFSLVNDSKGWLSIEEASGKVRVARSLQDAWPGNTYTVLVAAWDGSSLTPPLVPSRHLCTPRQDHGVIVSGPSGDPSAASVNGPYSFALGPDPTVQRDWRLQALNDSHAYLTLALHWVEPGEHMIPVVVHHGGRKWQLQVRVIVCRCNVDRQCMLKVGRMKGMPTKLSAVGTLVGTLAVIGFLLLFIFTHLSLTRKDLDQPVDSMPLKTAV